MAQPRAWLWPAVRLPAPWMSLLGVELCVYCPPCCPPFHPGQALTAQLVVRHPHTPAWSLGPSLVLCTVGRRCLLSGRIPVAFAFVVVGLAGAQRFKLQRGLKMYSPPLGRTLCGRRA